MSDWSDAVEFAIKRTAKNDKGAAAGKAGILGLPNPETGEKARRCYSAALGARQSLQRARLGRSKPEIAPGTTGNHEWDKRLGVA